MVNRDLPDPHAVPSCWRYILMHTVDIILSSAKAIGFINLRFPMEYIACICSITTLVPVLGA